MAKPSVVLIGPMSSGKSTIHTALSSALGYTAIELDDLRWEYYKELGYDSQKELEIRENEGLEAVLEYWKPFEIHAVERVMKAYPENHVIAFGAGHSVYEDEALLQRAKNALAPFPHVVLLLPTDNLERNDAILRARFQVAQPDIPAELVKFIMDLNYLMLSHHSNATLATHTIYTDGKSVEETCSEIMRLIAKE